MDGETTGGMEEESSVHFKKMIAFLFDWQQQLHLSGGLCDKSLYLYACNDELRVIDLVFPFPCVFVFRAFRFFLNLEYDASGAVIFLGAIQP